MALRGLGLKQAAHRCWNHCPTRAHLLASPQRTHQSRHSQQLAPTWRRSHSPGSRSLVAAATMTTAAAMDPTTLSKAPVVVVTIPACPYCKKAKAALLTAGIPFQELDASVDTELRALVRQVAGRSSVPQVFVGGTSFGGSDDLAAGLESGTFKAALAAATTAGTPALPSALAQAVSKVAAQQAAAPPPSGSAGAAGVDDAALSGVAEMLAGFRSGIKCTSKMVGGRPQQCFSGQQLLDWITASSSQTSSSSSSSGSGAAQQWLAQASKGGAAAAAAQLLAANLISLALDTLPTTPAVQGVQGLLKVDPGAQYYLVAGATPPLKGQPLNTAYWWNGPARPANQVAQDLRDLILRLYDRHLSPDGRAVSYQGIKADPLFQQYVKAAAELQRVDLAPLNREELCALFINLYNATIIHATVVHGSPTNTAQRVSFFTRDAAYCIAGQTYSADDMENGVLRGNRAAASNLFVLVGLAKLAGGQFKAGDPRASKVVTPMDPRIHFALVCGAKSCPPISVYTPDNLDEGLAAAGETFCAGEVEVDVAKRSVKLSKILQWYSIDFGANDTEKLQFVLQFLKGQQRSDLASLLASGQRVSVQYKPYDWGLNS